MEGKEKGEKEWEERRKGWKRDGVGTVVRIRDRIGYD